MERKLFRSKLLSSAVLIIFSAFLAAESFAQAENQAQTEFTKVFEAGKKLYEDGEHKEAALKLLQALTLAKEKAEITEACFYLSLAYFSLNESDNAQLYLKRLFETEPDRAIDARLFPSGYVALFYRAKSELAAQRPAKPEVKPKVEAPVAVPGKAAAEPQVKKKGKFPWLIVGGLVVAGGIVLYFVLNKKKASETGTISVGSTPTGARVFLDGTDTGLFTGCTLNNVSAGAHTVKLTKDGYADFQQSTTVIVGQTVAVNAALTKNTIAITSPAAGAVVALGTSYDIRWQTGSGTAAEIRPTISDSRTREEIAKPPSSLRFPRKLPGDFPGRRSTEADGGKAEGRSGSPIPDTAPGSPSPSLIPQVGVSLDIAKVKIDLYRGAVLVSTIIAEVDNTGSFVWTFPSVLTEGSDYKIRISCSTDSSIYGESGAFSLLITLYEFVTKWGSRGSANGQLYVPVGIAVDSVGNVYVSENFNHRIQKFTSSGVYITKWGSFGTGDGQFKYPWGVAVDRSGNILVADSSNNRIQKFTPAGVFISKFGSSGSGIGQFNDPLGMVVDAAGNIYVLEYGNNRVQKFDTNWNFLTTWGVSGTGDGQFNLPEAIAMDGSGNIYVADTRNFRIQKFTPNGGFLTKWGSFGSADGQFADPTGIAIDNFGSVLVVDYNNHRIQKFTSTGAFVAKWGTFGTGDGQFNHPEAIGTETFGNIYVTDLGNDRVQKFMQKTAAALGTNPVPRLSPLFSKEGLGEITIPPPDFRIKHR